MPKCLYAQTKLDPLYPGYVNLTREDDGSVSIHVRGDPRTVEGASYVCGHAGQDTGKPGRCTPGDERCNNYCNMAPAKGPMQPAPARCDQVICAETVKLSLSAAEFAKFAAEMYFLARKEG